MRTALVRESRIMIPYTVQYSFGPVPSRRLGKSVGINNIPPKVCTYSCAYCQVGRTTRMQIERASFYDPEDIVRDVQGRLARARQASERVDYLTFVPDGEPTLDANLGEEIVRLKAMGVPVGVITNSSLLWRDDVREELAKADWVSVKIDAVREEIWRRINRPHRGLRLSLNLDGVRTFARSYPGRLVTETMLVQGLNDGDDCVREVADIIRSLQPWKAYLSIPTRPTPEKPVFGPDEESLNRIYQIVAEKVPRVEYLIGYEGNDFAFSGDVENDLLSITAVHPMREEAVSTLLSRAGSSWAVVDRMVGRGELVVTRHDGHLFVLRKFTREREVAP